MGIRFGGVFIAGNWNDKFVTYTELLLEWNKKFNLTAVTNPDDIKVKHFEDSLSVLGCINERGKIIDIGTGAGFPGVPLKIVYSSLELTLLDSTRKKINFLDELIKELGLSKTEALHARAEELAHNPMYRGQYDFAVSRAVAVLRVLCELSIPFVKVGGSFISMKGPSVFDEYKEAGPAIKKLGAELSEIKESGLAGSKHYLVIINKIRETPEIYPRAMPKIKKAPL